MDFIILLALPFLLLSLLRQVRGHKSLSAHPVRRDQSGSYGVAPAWQLSRGSCRQVLQLGTLGKLWRSRKRIYKAERKAENSWEEQAGAQL